jgi:hypothetical protein
VHIVLDSFEATPSPESLHGIETIRGIDVNDAPGDAVAFPDTSRSVATSTSAPCCGTSGKAGRASKSRKPDCPE